MSNDRLLEKLQVLRDEVLDTAMQGDDPPAAFFFESVLRILEGESQQTVDRNLRDQVARRMAWGDQSMRILEDVDRVSSRLLDAVKRSVEDDREAIRVMSVTAQINSVTLRLVAAASAAAAQSDKARAMREELAQARLERALKGQQAEIRRLTDRD